MALLTNDESSEYKISEVMRVCFLVVLRVNQIFDNFVIITKTQSLCDNNKVIENLEGSKSTDCIGSCWFCVVT